jgi:hypothetical protein
MAQRLHPSVPAPAPTSLRGVARATLLAPWWALTLLSSDKSFADHPFIGSRRLNAWGLHRWRVQKSHALTAQRRERLLHWLDGVDAGTFARNGFVVKRNLLPEDQFEALRREVLGHRAPTREMLQGDTVTRHIAVNGALRQAVPALAPLLESRAWNGLTRYVAGHDQAPMTYVQAVLSHTRVGAADPQTHLHADTFHPTMKAWYFLNDVGDDESPFCYVPGSHRLTPARLQWEHERSLRGSAQADRYSARGSARVDKAELAAMGLGLPVRLVVPANTLIVADTFGFHKRARARRPSSRLEIWGNDRRNPFMPSSTDGLINLLAGADRRIDLYWAARDLAERLGGRRNPWRDCGLNAPGAPPQLTSHADDTAQETRHGQL